MAMVRKILSLLLAVVLVAGLAACGSEAIPEETPAPTEAATEASTEAATEAAEEESTLAPDFTVYDEAGNPHKLSDFRGKPVILNFWATWCGPCKNEMPEIQAAFGEYGAEINFLIVNLTDGVRDTVEQAAGYIAEQGYTFPVYFDTDDYSHSLYGVTSIPLTFFIDSEGNFLAYYLGSMSADIMQQGIDLLLGA